MTRYDTDTVRFGCRVAGIILRDGSVLLQGEPDGPFWTLPGGGIELLEPSPAALQRELREELGVDVQIDRLLWIVEQFFVSVLDGRACHEIGFYFLVAPLDAPHLADLEHTLHAVDGPYEVIFRWFKLADLDSVRLYPAFLPAALRALPLTPTHVVLVDDAAAVRS